MRTEWLQKRTGWFWDPKMSGGAAIEGIIHEFQFLPWLFGPVERIYAEAGTFIYTDREPTIPDDQLVVLWRFQSGAIGIIDGGANQASDFPGHTSVFFTGGAVRMEYGGPFRIYRGMTDYNPVVEEVNRFTPRDDDTRLVTSAYQPTEQIAEIRHFADCVLEDKEPETPGESGRYALECAWAAIKSFQTHLPVTLPLERPYPSY
jgi:myo-inositol 2-dehydrogenase/D-chiro-inositol 1-dehydrogenase